MKPEKVWIPERPDPTDYERRPREEFRYGPDLASDLAK